MKTYIEPGIKKDDVVLCWDGTGYTYPYVMFYIEDYECCRALGNSGVSQAAFIIKYTPEHAKMSTQELYDTVVDIQTEEAINYQKMFNDFWGDRGEKWNGKLDIKNFSEEVYLQACKDMINYFVNKDKKSIKVVEE